MDTVSIVQYLTGEIGCTECLNRQWVWPDLWYEMVRGMRRIYIHSFREQAVPTILRPAL